MNKALIAPIVALFCLTIKSTLGIQFDDQTLNIITDGILSIISLVGIFTHPKKDGV